MFQFLIVRTVLPFLSLTEWSNSIVEEPAPYNQGDEEDVEIYGVELSIRQSLRRLRPQDLEI